MIILPPLIFLDVRKDELICAMSRLLINHPLTGRRLLEASAENGGGEDGLEGLLLDGKSLVTETLGKEKGEELAAELFSKEIVDWAKREAEWYEKKGVKIIPITSSFYPPLLRECADAPFALYYKGVRSEEEADSKIFGRRMLSVVGTRLASQYGKECCTLIISELALNVPNLQIISGLAMGIDSCAHLAALDNSLETFAVLPCGIDQIYPASNRDMAVRILQQGGVLTEYPRGTKPLRFNFLQRNRIIAGMSDALLVAESRVSGGSMSTVEYASGYGRDIFAVPARMNDANSYGCNYLINKNVAQLVLNGNSIVNSMGWAKDKISDILQQPSLFSSTRELKAKLLLSLSFVKGTDEETIIGESGAEVGDVSLALLELELEGKIRKVASGGWIKC